MRATNMQPSYMHTQHTYAHTRITRVHTHHMTCTHKHAIHMHTAHMYTHIQTPHIFTTHTRTHRHTDTHGSPERRRAPPAAAPAEAAEAREARGAGGPRGGRSEGREVARWLRAEARTTPRAAFAPFAHSRQLRARAPSPQLRWGHPGARLGPRRPCRPEPGRAVDARARARPLPSPGKRRAVAGPGRRTLRASPGPAPAADSEPLPAPSEVTTDAAAGLQSPRPFGGRGAEGSLAEGTQHPAPAHAARSLSADHRTVPAAPRCRRGARAACFFGFWGGTESQRGTLSPAGGEPSRG